jgi:hypothetical protein
MRIALFDQINEVHVCESLASSLAASGCEVTWTGKIWHGHTFPSREEDVRVLDEHVEKIIASSPDALLNFRASSLSAAQVSRLRAAGIRTLVWLPDDPVLYGLTYGQIVDAYDIALHCGNTKVLEFYRHRGHKPGVNFPFWIDPTRFQYSYEPSLCEHALVFFGNMHGPAKSKRYDAICSLHEDLAIYGKVPSDPLGKCKGQLAGPEEAVKVLPRHRVGLNMAQYFGDYTGTSYAFPGLSMLGHFFLPSRVLQYAAIGLPVLTIQPGQFDAAHYPAGWRVSDPVQAQALLSRVLPQNETLLSVSARARQQVEMHFSAQSRAKYLLYLLKHTDDIPGLTMHEREFQYQTF